MQEEKQVHDRFTIYLNQWENFKILNPDQSHELINMLFEYTATGQFTPSNDALVNVMFNNMRPLQDANWTRFDEGIKSKKHNAMIGKLKQGLELSNESVMFLKENGYLTEKYLKEKGIDKAIIDKLLAIASDR